MMAAATPATTPEERETARLEPEEACREFVVVYGFVFVVFRVVSVDRQ